MNSSRLFRRLAWTATALTLVVIVAGAWVRLTHAGLGCPDWPGCYGMVTWPKTPEHIETATREFSQHTGARAVDSGKAFREMFHRYVAGILGFLILALAVIAWRDRRRFPGHPVALPGAILALVIFQAVLGMWTVTLLLKPAIVTAHLIGGMSTFLLLLWLSLRVTPRTGRVSLPARAQALPIVVVLAVIAVQVVLGGWVSTNYAALACTGFPTCSGQWWPEMNFSEGFRIWRGVGVDYEGGVLDPAARNAIHMVHRIWAVAVVGAFAWLFWRLWRVEELRTPVLLTGLILVVQIVLGITNVVAGLPLANAVAHNGVAALLLGGMVLMLERTRQREAS